MEVIKKLLERQVPLLPNLNFCTCDVRDVATAHIRAMTFAEAANNRHIIASTEECNSMLDYALILDAEFRNKGYNVPTKVAPNIFVKFASVFDKSIALITPMLGKKFRFENNRMKNVLQIEPIPLKKTIIDMANNMIEKGKIIN
jgi:nucleoside-diphosphate-sugar epimerase